MDQFKELNEIGVEAGKQPATTQIDVIPQDETFNKASAYSSDPAEMKNQILTRLRLKSKILAYKSAFLDELQAYELRISQLDSLSIPDLEILLEELKITVQQRRGGSVVKNCYFSTINMMEVIAKKFNHPIPGFHRSVLSNKEINKCLDEISLELEDSFYIPAHFRLILATAQTYLTITTLQKIEEKVSNEMQKKVPESIVKKYDHL